MLCCENVNNGDIQEWRIVRGRTADWWTHRKSCQSWWQWL